MATRLGPFPVTFCNKCNYYNAQIPEEIHSQTLNALSPMVMTAIKTAVNRPVAQGTAEIYFNPHTWKITVGHVDMDGYECYFSDRPIARMRQWPSLTGNGKADSLKASTYRLMPMYLVAPRTSR